MSVACPPATVNLLYVPGWPLTSHRRDAEQPRLYKAADNLAGGAVGLGAAVGNVFHEGKVNRDLPQEDPLMGKGLLNSSSHLTCGVGRRGNSRWQAVAPHRAKRLGAPTGVAGWIASPCAPFPRYQQHLPYGRL